MNLGIIELEEMEFRAFHGCYPLERIVGNRFLVNVTIKADLSLPAASDNVNDTINYLSVYETVRDEMKIESHSGTCGPKGHRRHLLPVSTKSVRSGQNLQNSPSPRRKNQEGFGNP